MSEPGFEFRFKFEDKGLEVRVRLPNPHATIDEVLDVFEPFLKAVGYEVPGTLKFDEKECVK